MHDEVGADSQQHRRQIAPNTGVCGKSQPQGLLGRPGRITALQRFLDHIAAHDRVWVCRRIDIARHWTQVHPYPET